ncbi:hypothetical protein [Streptomyces niveus]|uniref:hypothetical protein n=1 Tax=Streptomyces niveus TaxID=193462 RepID=UPI0004CF0961|nr:hypothetical protein [Streptomyces niveus]
MSATKPPLAVSIPARISLPSSAWPTVWLATADGLVLIDTIAVERAMNGDRQGWSLSEDEARYAAQIMFEHGVPYSVVASRTGKSVAVIRRWFPGQAVPSVSTARPRNCKPIKCGTTRGYYAHHRRKETPCTECKAANASADRRYRLTGSSKAVTGVAA